MSAQNWWNDTDIGEPKYSEKRLSDVTLSTVNPVPGSLESKAVLRGQNTVN